jgi:hypothetical protein
MGSSVVVEYVDTGATVEGSLFSDGDAPTTNDDGNTAWIPNHTYDVSEMNTTAYVANSDGLNELGSDFEIIELQDATTGESLNYTTTVQYTGVNTNATDAIELSRQLENLEAAVDNRTIQEDGTVPPFNPAAWGIMEWAAIISAIIGVILLIAAAARS